MYIKDLKKGESFKFNDKVYIVRRKFSDWKKDDNPYLITTDGEIFYHDELEIEKVLNDKEIDLLKNCRKGLLIYLMGDDEKKLAKRLLSLGYLIKGKMEEGKAYFVENLYF